ncbi:Flp family type IVb pilin [Vampirovibrio chlorellavorus]|uniref:Flp family type IVb pilin n=1 Tax=Vampirovibrio chlorellavorus TaxID=758823 RepID=UPI0026ED543C|nr:Flp family type IVb pilin [Vampirovibrio chlorellavorus]
MPKRSAHPGVSLTEYGLILACVVCVCLAALQSLGSQLSGQFQSITDKIGKVSGNLGNPSSPSIPNPPASPPVTAPGGNLGINAEALSPYPNNGIAGSVAGTDKNNPAGGVTGPLKIKNGKPPTGTSNGSSP